MSRFNRRKIALTLACASILGGKTQAMKEPQSQQNLAAVSGVTPSKFNKLTKKQKIAIGLGVGLGVVSVGVISTIIALAIKGKNSDTDSGNPTKAKNTTDELENKGKNQQENEKGKFYEKNQKMIKDGIATLGDELQERYDAIRKLILNYKNNDLSSHINNIYDTIDDCNIQNSDNIKNEHREKYIKMLDEFIDIYSGEKELIEFSAEDGNMGLYAKVYSKYFHYNIFQNEVQIQKVNNDGIIFNMNINIENLID